MDFEQDVIEYLYDNRVRMLTRNDDYVYEVSFVRTDDGPGKTTQTTKIQIADYDEEDEVLFGVIEHNFRRCAKIPMIKTCMYLFQSIKTIFGKSWSHHLIFRMAFSQASKTLEEIVDDDVPLFYKDFGDWYYQMCGLSARHICAKLSPEKQKKLKDNIDPKLKSLIESNTRPQRVVHSSQKAVYRRRAERLSKIPVDKALQIVSEIKERLEDLDKEEDSLIECMMDPDLASDRADIIAEGLIGDEMIQMFKRESASMCKKMNEKIANYKLQTSFEKECIICLDSIPNTRLEPCNHVVLCEECLVELRKKSDLCPMCRCSTSGWSLISKK
jgi:hypothetical protein